MSSQQPASRTRPRSSPLPRQHGSSAPPSSTPSSTASVLGVIADYVTAEQGTGAVHTSPAHGVDDFYTGKRYDLPELQYVDNAGRQRTPPTPQAEAWPSPTKTSPSSSPIPSSSSS